MHKLFQYHCVQTSGKIVYNLWKARDLEICIPVDWQIQWHPEILRSCGTWFLLPSRTQHLLGLQVVWGHQHLVCVLPVWCTWQRDGMLSPMLWNTCFVHVHVTSCAEGLYQNTFTQGLECMAWATLASAMQLSKRAKFFSTRIWFWCHDRWSRIPWYDSNQNNKTVMKILHYLSNITYYKMR